MERLQGHGVETTSEHPTQRNVGFSVALEAAQPPPDGGVGVDKAFLGP